MNSIPTRFQNTRRALVLLFSAAQFFLISAAYAQETPLPEIKIESGEDVFANINTGENEFSPVISPDGSFMLFNSKRGGRYQDIYISRKENGIWGPPSPMTILNSPYNDESPFISAGGKIILFSSDRDGSLEMPKNSRGQIKVSYDLYWSHLVGGQWSRPTPVPGVNTPHHEKAPSLSRDGNTLFFSQWQWGKPETAKIFQAGKSEHGFANPEPVEAVNTGHMEVILIPDERGMGFFFSAAREDSLGGFDIYYISYYEGEFGKAVNLGKPINSEANEAYFSIHQGVIYFCSDRRGEDRKFDIMSSELPRESKVNFLVIDTEGEPIDQVNIKITGSDNTLREKSSNEFGRSEFYLNNSAESFNVFIEKPSYIPVYKQYSPGEIFKGLHTITLQELEEKADFNFKELYFDTASDQIQERSLPFLKALAAWLVKNPDVKILIIGHTDSRGSQEYNLKLSLDRAEAVKNFLIGQGVQAEKLQTKGAGESQAGSEGDMARERKTEFILLDMDKNP